MSVTPEMYVKWIAVCGGGLGVISTSADGSEIPLRIFSGCLAAAWGPSWPSQDLGLGRCVTLDTVMVPTEVVIEGHAKYHAHSVHRSDSAFLTIEQIDGTAIRNVEWRDCHRTFSKRLQLWTIAPIEQKDIRLA
jgi:hypothetical protein